MLAEKQVVPEANLQANEAIIRQHLHHITRRWGEIEEPCLLELVFLTAEDKARVRQVSHYTPDSNGLDLAAADCAAMNAHKINAYATVNPVLASRRPKAGDRASAPDIAASFFHWADGDSSVAADEIRSFVGPRPTFYIITGTQPCVRPHVYWELEEPTRNLEAWTQTQRAIAARLKTDAAVIDPPRIMRIGGTINWPKPQKASKGYVPELTSLKIHSEDERPRIASDRMARAFPAATRPAENDTGFRIDTGAHDRRTADDYSDILRRARTDGEKHSGVRDLAASLAGSGVPRAMAEAIVRSACPVWDENVADLVDSAYHKFFVSPEVREAQDAMAPPEAPAWPSLYDAFDEAAIPPRKWIYGRHYLRNFVSVLASAGGIGKTSLQIVEALAICTGKPLLGEAVEEPCNVWLINLEDPMDEMQRRVIAAMKAHKITPEEVRGKLFLDAGRDFSLNFATQTREGVIPNDRLVEYLMQEIPRREIGAVFIDPFVGAHQINENDNMAVNSVVSQIRKVADETNCAIGLVHHVRKGNGADADIDSVRGAGSLIGAARAARVINRVSEDDAIKLGIREMDAKGIFRVDDGKANLAPPAAVAVYRKMEGVHLENGDWVGVAKQYALPDEWGGMTEAVINDILRAIDAGITDMNGNTEYFSKRPQDKDRWVGDVITGYKFQNPDDMKNEGQAKRIIAGWLKSGLLEDFQYRSEKQRKNPHAVRSTGRVGAQS